jgi:hypothetical protein
MRSLRYLHENRACGPQNFDTFSKTTFATLSAPNGPADPIERCLLVGAKQKISALSEYFAI